MYAALDAVYLYVHACLVYSHMCSLHTHIHQQVCTHLANWGLTALQDRWQWWLWGKWWIVQCQYMTPKWGQHHLDQEVEVRGWCPAGMAERRDTLLNVCIQVVTAGKWTHAFGNSLHCFGHVWSCLDTLYIVLTSRMAKWVRWSQPHSTLSAVSFSTRQLWLSHAPNPSTHKHSVHIKEKMSEYSRSWKCLRWCKVC